MMACGGGDGGGTAAPCSISGGCSAGGFTTQNECEEAGNSWEAKSYSTQAECEDAGGTWTDPNAAGGNGSGGGGSFNTCTPDCGDRVCGQDGCGDVCGTCDAGSLCSKGACVDEASCADTCESTGSVCGTICGAECGTCATGSTCSSEQLCVDSTVDTCTDTCASAGLLCGEVCGVSCGTCADGESCTDGACVAGSSPNCVEDGCPAGDTCNQTTGECETPTGTGDVCTTCGADSDCPGGWSCISLVSGKVCLEPCTTNDACDTGWSCVGSPSVCTPDISYSCDGCVSAGCPDGQTCDPESGECAVPGGLCEPCTENWHCGPGAGCINEPGGGKVCKPRCSPGGAACPESASCQLDSDSQLNVCAYDAAQCCYDTQAVCGAGVTCSGATPILLNGACVQCATDDDCEGGGSCNQSNNTCESAECSGATPYLIDGECVECLTNDHCPDGNCNTDSHECKAADDACGECNADYPVCLELNNDTYCVQCSEDSHCDAGCTCDTNLYACSGNCVVSGGEQCTPGDNSTCPSHPDYNLICHESGLCVADNGGCDGVNVQCPFGNPCVGLMDLLLGGGGLPGGLPGMPGGGTGGMGIPGACSCTPNGPEDPNSDDCPGDVQCAAFDLLGSGSETTVCSSLSCEDILGELLGPLAAIICAGL